MTCWLAQARTMRCWPPSTSWVAILENPPHFQEWMMWFRFCFCFLIDNEKRDSEDLVPLPFRIFSLLVFFLFSSYFTFWRYLFVLFAWVDLPWVLQSVLLPAGCTPLQGSTWTCPFTCRCLSCCAFPCLCAQLLSCVCLLCDPTDCSLPSSSLHGSGLPFPPPGDLPNLEIKPTSPACVSCIARQILYHWESLPCLFKAMIVKWW